MASSFHRAMTLQSDKCIEKTFHQGQRCDSTTLTSHAQSQAQQFFALIFPTTKDLSKVLFLSMLCGWGKRKGANHLTQFRVPVVILNPF